LHGLSESKLPGLELPLLSLLIAILFQSSSLLLVLDCRCRGFRRSSPFSKPYTLHRSNNLETPPTPIHSFIPQDIRNSLLGCFGTPCRSKIKQICIQSLPVRTVPAYTVDSSLSALYLVYRRKPAYTGQENSELFLPIQENRVEV